MTYLKTTLDEYEHDEKFKDSLDEVAKYRI
jgi:hypothetical protein